MHKVAVATVACWSAMIAMDADADTRQPTHIPAQQLGSALQALAHDRQFYVIFAAQDIVGLQTQGVTGELTSQEALQQLLNGTGLTFRFVDDKTVNILPIRAEARLLTESTASNTGWSAAPPPPPADTAASEEDDELVTVTVIGSRGLPRTDVERPVPVDIVSGRDLMTTGQTDLAQQVQFNSPSFNSAKYGVNGTTNYADPASLRGLAPDQVLVLVNGKRRHQFSALNLNVAPGLGTVVTDLNSIPSSAIERIEVLRDGAAAQYGSDAIAGIINLVLNEGEGGSVTGTAGTHKEGDGDTFKASLNQGFLLGAEGGFVNVTLEAFDFSGTNRSDPYDGPIYPATPANYAQTGPTPAFPYATANPRRDRGVYPQGAFVIGNYGSNENRTYQAFINSELPLSQSATLYGFGGYSEKEIKAFGFYRAPSSAPNSALGVFPDGFVPVLPGESIDYSAVAGVKGTMFEHWNYDASGSFGENYLDLSAYNTVNPSLGDASPTEFYIGRTTSNQAIGEFNVSRLFGEVGPLQSMSVALGAQVRRDNFSARRGSLESYQVGPLAFSGRAVGASGRPGIAPEDEIDISRTNVGAYVDVESDVTDALLIATALRFEDYNDFGSNLSGKLAMRYKLTDSFAVRGSYNRGFRAPSLAQLGNRVNTSTVQNGEIIVTKQVSSDDPRLAQLGVADPDAEISDNFNLGLTAEFGGVLGGEVVLTLDAFHIDIEDRIAITDRILTSAFPAVAALFPQTAEIRFFTNQIDTRTRGVDLVTTYSNKFDSGLSLDLSLAGSYNETEVLSQRATPAQLLVGATGDNRNFLLVDQTAIELIEVATPRTKILLSSKVGWGDWTGSARATYFGSVKAFSTGLSGLDPNVDCDARNRCVQKFDGKTLVDLSLTYAVSDALNLTLGANNVFDTYPDEWNSFREGFAGQASNYTNGQIPYSRNSNQFGFNGAYYYLTAAWTF
ncbi:MAG: TonB-dependent receptor [Steroidobacter sp.]